MIEEHFNEDSGFLVAHYTGVCDLGQVVEYIRRTKANKDYPRKLKILSFAENMQLDLTLDDLKVISEENKLSVAHYDFIADAYVTDEALVAAMSSMYQHVSQAKKYYFKVFSSVEAASEWLNNY